jgi:hypothetical protein
VLGPLVVGQWAATAVFALVVRHNGWLFYQGGDETFYYTDAWSIAHAHIPEAEIGFGWSYIVSPVALFAGPNLLDGLPALVLFQTFVLAPVALYCVYEITARVGGRVLGYAATVLWIATPFVLIPLFEHRYHEKYVEQFLPQAFGLTGLADFPSMVCLLVAALLCFRALDGGDLLNGLLAGLLAGFAIAIKPANTLFLAGPALAFLAARRFRPAVGFAAALVPPLLALALWKYRGLGHLPIVSSTAASAAGATPAPAASSVSRYVNLDWSRLRDNYVQLREFLWSAPLLQALPLAGLAGALLRATPKALLLAGWTGAFLLVKGSSNQASIEGGTLLRLFMPGFPPLVIFVALVPLLIPFAWDRLRDGWRPPGARARPRLLLAATVILGVLPVVLLLAFPPLHDQTVVKDFDENVMVPVDRSFGVSVRGSGPRRILTWNRRSSSGVASFYRVFRVRPVRPAPDPTLPPGQDGIRCLALAATAHDRAADCRLEMTYLGPTRSTRFVDTVPRGRWVYRVGIAANWRDDTGIGDVLLLSAPGRSSAR